MSSRCRTYADLRIVLSGLPSALHRLAIVSQPAELANAPAQSVTAPADVPEEADTAAVVQPPTAAAQAEQVSFTRAQEVQHAILQALHADDSNGSMADASAADGSEEESNSDDDDDVLAQLSANMWAALRPETAPGADAANQQSTGHDAAAPDSLQGAQPKNVQPAGEQDWLIDRYQASVACTPSQTQFTCAPSLGQSSSDLLCEMQQQQRAGKLSVTFLACCLCGYPYH